MSSSSSGRQNNSQPNQLTPESAMEAAQEWAGGNRKYSGYQAVAAERVPVQGVEPVWKITFDTNNSGPRMTTMIPEKVLLEKASELQALKEAAQKLEEGEKRFEGYAVTKAERGPIDQTWRITFAGTDGTTQAKVYQDTTLQEKIQELVQRQAADMLKAERRRPLAERGMGGLVDRGDRTMRRGKMNKPPPDLERAAIRGQSNTRVRDLIGEIEEKIYDNLELIMRDIRAKKIEKLEDTLSNKPPENIKEREEMINELNELKIQKARDDSERMERRLRSDSIIGSPQPFVSSSSSSASSADDAAAEEAARRQAEAVKIAGHSSGSGTPASPAELASLRSSSSSSQSKEFSSSKSDDLSQPNSPRPGGK